MFVDASAIVAILGDEPEGPDLAQKIGGAGRSATSPVAVFEASLAIARIYDIKPTEAETRVGAFLRSFSIQLVPLPAGIATLAVEGFERYGKGRHPAGLNLGDCLAYAMAKSIAAPILFKGNDFSQTDIQQA